MSGLRLPSKTILDNAADVIEQLDNLLAALQGMGASTKDTGLESDPLINAWELAMSIRQTLLKNSGLRSDISPAAQQERDAMRNELASIPQKTDDLFAITDQILAGSATIREENLQSQRAMPGIELTTMGAVDAYVAVPTGDKKQDRLVESTMKAGARLFPATQALQAALTGGQYAIKKGVHTTVAGNVDLAESIKKVAANALGARAH